MIKLFDRVFVKSLKTYGSVVDMTDRGSEIPLYIIELDRDINGERLRWCTWHDLEERVAGTASTL